MPGLIVFIPTVNKGSGTIAHYKQRLMTVASVVILTSLLLQTLLEADGQGLTANISQKSYGPGETLVVFGKSLPNDSLITELFNPRGRLASRTQIDVGVEGSFSRILIEWPSPNDNFPFGIYTLTLTSSINKELKTNLVFKFADLQTGTVIQERRLELQISVPTVIGKNEASKLIVEVLVNGVLVKGSGEETLKGSRIYYPDGTILPISNFTAIDDGIYLADFRSRLVGHHLVLVQVFHQGLLASNAQGVYVAEGRILSLGKEIDRVNENLENLNTRVNENLENLNTRVNENLENLRAETIERNNQLADAVEKVSQASGQVASLLLPVIGMIVVVVVLEATILSRRGKIHSNHKE